PAMRTVLRTRVVLHLLLTCAMLTMTTGFAWASKVEIWRQDTTQAFAKAKKEHVVVSDAGRIRLGRAVATTGAIEASHVWDLARAKDGVVYAATGNAGKVYRKEGEGDWTVAYDAEDSQALSAVALADGRVFVGLGPSGSIVEISRRDAKP